MGFIDANDDGLNLCLNPDVNVQITEVCISKWHVKFLQLFAFDAIPFRFVFYSLSASRRSLVSTGIEVGNRKEYKLMRLWELHVTQFACT